MTVHFQALLKLARLNTLFVWHSPKPPNSIQLHTHNLGTEALYDNQAQQHIFLDMKILQA